MIKPENDNDANNYRNSVFLIQNNKELIAIF